MRASTVQLVTGTRSQGWYPWKLVHTVIKHKSRLETFRGICTRVEDFFHITDKVKVYLAYLLPQTIKADVPESISRFF